MSGNHSKLSNFFFKSEVLLKMILRLRRMDSWQSRQKTPWKEPKFFNQWPKLNKKDRFAYNKNSLSSEVSHGHVETRFGNPAGKLSPKSRIFFAQCPETLSKHVFFPKLFLLKMILCMCRKRFWQLCQETCSRWPKTIRPRSESNENFYFSRKNCFQWKCSYSYVEVCFGRFTGNFLTEG